MSKHQATEEQMAYAVLLNKGMKIGMILLTITFFIYISGLLAPHVPVDDLPKYWSLPVKDYLEQADIHTGWSWLGKLENGDFLNFIGIAFLAGVTIVCYIAVIPIFIRKKDKVYALLAVLEVVILALAASGLLKSGGH